MISHNVDLTMKPLNRTSNHLKTSSELVYNCVGYISLNPDYISFERVFMSYKKYRLYFNKFRYN